MLLLSLYLFCTAAAPIAVAAITWRADVGGAVYSSPVFSASGDLYVSSYDGNLYSIAANGSRTWRVFLGPLYYSPLFVPYSKISDHFPRSSNGSESGTDFPKVFAGYNTGGGGLGVVAGISSTGQLLSRDAFGVGSLQCAPQYLRGALLSCDDGGFIVALAGDGRGQLWSADVHGGSVLSNIVVFDNVLGGMLCVGGAAHRIACLDANGSAIWNTTSGGSSDDFVTLLSSARGGASLLSGAAARSSSSPNSAFSVSSALQRHFLATSRHTPAQTATCSGLSMQAAASLPQPLYRPAAGARMRL